MWLRRRLLEYHNAKPTRASKTTPPIIPPTMGPTFELGFEVAPVIGAVPEEDWVDSVGVATVLLPCVVEESDGVEEVALEDADGLVEPEGLVLLVLAEEGNPEADIKEAKDEACEASKVVGVGVADAIAKAHDGMACGPVGRGDGKS